MKIEVGRFSDVLRRFLLAKGVQDVAGELSPEISAVFVMESDRADWRFLMGEKLLATSTPLSTAAATVGGTMRLRNPLGSGIIATVTAGTIACSVSTHRHELRVGPLLADLGTIVPSNSRDTRLFGDVAGLIASADSAVAPAGGPAALWDANVLADTVIPIPAFPIVLTPGHNLDLGVGTAGIKLTQISFVWSERALPGLEAE